MKNYYTLLFLFFLSFTAQSQDTGFSVELNYPMEMAQGFDEVTGIANAGIKYRFAQSEYFAFGISLSADYLKRGEPKVDSYYSFEDIDRKFFFLHLGAFAEMNLPNAEKFHPFAGLGYSYVTYDYLYIYMMDDFGEVETRTERDPGINFNFGIQYDLTPTIFVQSYFHFIRTYDKTDFMDEEIFAANTNMLKVGVGFKF